MPSFLHTDTRSFFPPQPHPIVAAAGSSQNLWAGQNQISGTGTLATLTVLMPPAPSPGAVVTIIPTVAVTALTMKDAVGGAVAGGYTALVAGTQARMMWSGSAWTKLS